MIKGNSYLCTSADVPTKTTLICYQEGCTVYPFLCGKDNCACMILHGSHRCKLLSELLETMVLPPKPPADLAKEEKDIDSLIDKLRGELQLLKQRHKAHIERHSLNTHKYAGMLQRLLEGKQL